jgi:hypothetical protein
MKWIWGGLGACALLRWRCAILVQLNKGRRSRHRMPACAHDTRRPTDLRGNECELRFGHTEDIDLDVKRLVDPELREKTTRHDI